MTPKQQVLYALMENAGYSIGCIQTALALLGQSREALDAEERILVAQYNTKLCEISLRQLSGEIMKYAE